MVLTTAVGDASHSSADKKSNKSGDNVMRQSLNFSNGAGKISAIEFQGDAKKAHISFHDSDLERHNSNFNEDLLNSSGAASLNVASPTSDEFQLKAAKSPLQLNGDKDLEISIDIEWPAERIEAEYRKQ